MGGSSISALRCISSNPRHFFIIESAILSNHRRTCVGPTLGHRRFLKMEPNAKDSHGRAITLSGLALPHVVNLTIGSAAIIFEGAMSLAEPWPLKIVLDTVLKTKPEHGWFHQCLAATIGTDRIATVSLAAIAVMAIAAMRAASTFVGTYLTTSVGQSVTHDLRQALYVHIHRLSLLYHEGTCTGDLVARLTSDIDSVQSFITSVLLGSFISILTLAGMVVVMACLNWQFTLIALSVTPLLAYVVFHYTLSIKRTSREMRKKEGELVSIVHEVLAAIRVVKAFGSEEYEQQRLAEESRALLGIALKARSKKAKFPPVVDLIVAAGTSLVLWFGGRMALSGTLSAGALVLFIWYLSKIYKPMRDLSKTADAYSKAMVGYERIKEVLQTDQGAVMDLPGARSATQFHGEIDFDRVTFGYSANRPVLLDVSFKIEAGQTAALVGPTGAGKSTIISLIPRFYDPNAGTVKIDGTDIRTVQQKSLRRQISFVLQESVLFHGTVAHNISYGKPDATRSEILSAAIEANAHEFIERLPEGYETIIGERGMTLSGGERQRIAIARAVIRNSPILIMDEPGTGLDAASEKLVFDALNRLMKGRTSILIAHNLSTIRSADVIFVVDKGRIAERGTHAELLQKRGLYMALHELQFSNTDATDAYTASPIKEYIAYS
jgi:ATP-binding cassette subfamily B protein